MMIESALLLEPDTANEVLVVYVKDEGVRSESDVSEKYNTDWNVQFPKNLRQDGCRFVVDELREAKNGSFYPGDIRRLV